MCPGNTSADIHVRDARDNVLSMCDLSFEGDGDNSLARCDESRSAHTNST